MAALLSFATAMSSKTPRSSAMNIGVGEAASSALTTSSAIVADDYATRCRKLADECDARLITKVEPALNCLSGPALADAIACAANFATVGNRLREIYRERTNDG
jgi:hypothetical protein